MPTTQDLTLPAATIRQLMRQNCVTIRGLARKYNISLTRIREVRASGVHGTLAEEWFYLITGKWLTNCSTTEINCLGGKP